MVRIALAGLHLLALGIGFGAVIDRAGALRSSPGPQSLRRAFTADSRWGIAALLWIGTGVWRVLAGSEKPTVYYAHSPLFMAKMTLFLLIVVLEVWPMITLIRWRVAYARGRSAELVARSVEARRIAMISYIEATLLIAMIFVAVALARGL